MATEADRISALLEQAVERVPLAEHAGLSGASLERVVLADGRALIVKRMSPATDLAMRRAHDDGRLYRMWTAGIFERFPDAIDHAMIAVECEGDEIVVAMRDRTETLVGDRVLTREENRRILAAASALYTTFRGEDIPGLCSLRDWVDRLEVGEEESAHPVYPLIKRGWERFSDVVPDDVTEAVFAVRRDPEPMARALAACEKSLAHGDFRLANVGLDSDRVVLLDWGSFTAMAPPAVEFAWYLAISWAQIDAPIEAIVDDYRELAGDRFDAHALDLGFLLALVNLGWNKAIAALDNPDESARARERDHLTWWVAQVRRTLETWSPV